MVDWKKLDVRIIAKYCADYYNRYHKFPSLRDIFYRFVDELWPNTKSIYKRLSVWLRDKRLDGKIDWRLIRDGAKREYDKGDWIYRTPRQHVLTWLKLFVHIGEKYDLPMWLGQPKMVAVVSEKEADYPIIQSLTRDLNVDTAYVRGYSGWELLFKIAEEFKKSEKEELVIIALADFDPSGGAKADRGGKDLVSHILKAMLKLGIENVSVEKVAVTKEQIEKFKLPHRPEDVSEIAKLKRDPRFKTWPYGLYRVETAAFRVKAPDEFDRVIRDAVKKHFDEDIYKVVKEKEEEAQEIIKDFFESQEDLIDELRENIKTDEELGWKLSTSLEEEEK